MTMCANSPQQDLLPMELPSISSAAGSRARMFPSLESGLALKVRDLVYGVSTGALLAKYDPAGSSWRTSQACLVSEWERFSGTFPRSGSMRSGIVYQLQPSAPLIGVTEYGLWPTPQAHDAATPKSPEQLEAAKARALAKHGRPMGFSNLNERVQMWPTPRATDGSHGGRVTERKGREGGNLIEAVSARMFPTPTARDWRSGKASLATMERNARPLSEAIGGSLNPTWVEWLQGFPPNWTEVD